MRALVAVALTIALGAVALIRAGDLLAREVETLYAYVIDEIEDATR